MENVFTLLRRDHARLQASARPSGGSATRSLARQWAIHFLTEENFLFPRLAGDSVARPLLRSLSETHALMREDFRELLASDGEADEDTRVADLHDTLRKTVEFEEKRLFRRAEKLISPAEAEALGRDVEDFREELRLTLEQR
jgi:hypothetical protein